MQIKIVSLVYYIHPDTQSLFIPPIIFSFSMPPLPLPKIQSLYLIYINQRFIELSFLSLIYIDNQ